MDAGNGKRHAGTEARTAIRSYEDIEAYQRAMRLLVPVHRLALTFPDYERFELASQLRRASKSIPANIAEGYGKKASARQFKAYLDTALGSANEVIVHLNVALELGYAAPTEVDELIAGYTVVAKQLHRLRDAWQTFEPSEPRNPASRVSHPASRSEGGYR
jgi:four helix bundle protein